MKKILLCFALIIVMPICVYAESPVLSIYFLDVGQGDATLLISGDDVMLVDTGPDGGLAVLQDQLKQCGVDEIDYLVVTHPHDDHDAGLKYLAGYYTISHLVMPQYADDEEDYGDLLREMVGQGTQIVYPNVGDQYTIGEAAATILCVADPSRYPDDKNLWSIVMRVECGDTSIILTGDVEDINEFAMIDAGLDLDADVLKVGHHGSSTSSSGAFVEAVSPEYAIISCGVDNQYGHPHDETLYTLDQYQASVFRTDLNGTICLATDGSTYTISPSIDVVADETVKATPIQETYVLNTRSKKFHYPSCGSVGQTKDKCKANYTGTRDDLIDQGYSPCGRCKP